MAKISVIVPVYNAEKYLRQCLDSIVSQTLRDIEIICVNDGSTDASLSILEEYAAKDSRIVVISKPNAGYGHSMNMGLDKATGEYMGIVDADDYILPTMYETLYQYAKQSNLDFVRGAYYKFYEVDGEERVTYWRSMGTKYIGVVYCPRKTPDFWLSAVLTPSGIYRMDFLKKNQIRYNETPGAAFQDQGFWFRTHLLAERVLFIDEAFYMYRFDNPNSSIYKRTALDIMGKEYDDIRSFVAKRPDLAYIALPFYWKARYLNCRIIYSRDVRHIGVGTLDPLYRPFKQAKESGELDMSLFDSGMLNSLKLLLENPRRFCRNLKIDTSYALYQEHINRDLNGKSQGRRYQFNWYCKRCGIGFGIYMAVRKVGKMVQTAIKKHGKSLYYKLDAIHTKFSPEYEKRKRATNQMIALCNKQTNLDYRNSQMFWWSINKPGESLTETKKRFFLNMPKAEGKLRVRQEEYIAVLEELKKLLEANNIVFWPMGGTMIGMLRHQGFVPWDDDVDISMMYEDKEKLFEIVNKSQTLRIEEVYWCDPNTVLRCPRVRFKDCARTGLVDIFLWERANNEPTGFRPLWNKRNMYVSQMNEEYRKLKPRLHKLWRNEAAADPADQKLLDGLFVKTRKRCIQACGTGGSTIYGSVDMWFQAGKWLAVYDKTSVFPMKPVLFEGKQYMVPKCAEQFLTDQYGDWLSVPDKVKPSHGG